MSFRSPQGLRRLSLHATLIATAFAAVAAGPAVGDAAASTGFTRQYHQADRAVVSTARSLARCQARTHAAGTTCAARRRALQKAGLRLSRLQRASARTAATARRSTLSPSQQAPILAVTGATLSWKKVSTVSAYVLVRKVAGQSDLYSVVNGTSTTPAAVPGKTVTYGVRTAVVGSAWSREVQVRYATAALLTAAPKVTADGQTVRWTSTVGVSRYVMVTKEPGVVDVYATGTGTSITPPAKPGKTVRYSVRNDVADAAWGDEVSIAYAAAATTPAPATTTTQPGAGTPTTGTTSSNPATGTTTPAVPVTSPSPAPSAPSTAANFQMGINSGSAISWQLGFITLLNAKHARMEFDIATPASDIAPIVLQYAQAGIQPMLLAGFQGRTPTAAEAQNLATWAAAFGPGGTLWQGKSLPAATAVTRIEFGNETNNPYQYTGWTLTDDWYANAAYLDRAKEYARQAKNAALAVKAANPNVGILAVGDQYSGYTTWINAMFDAVPDLADVVAGWTVHPYGPNWKIPMDNMIAAMKQRGAVDKPLYATEWGVSSDNGRCLSDNFGFDKCMTYSTAAATLHDAVTGMRARYGSRLAAVFLYSTSDLKATGASTDREQYFGALRNDKSAKGAYTDEVKALMAAGA
jgi:hypothetical protein